MRTQSSTVISLTSEKTIRPRAARVAIGSAAAAVLGLAAITLPALYAYWQEQQSLPPLTLQYLGLDHFQPISLLLLGVAGVVASLVAGRGNWKFVGPCTMLAFPLLMAIEIARDPTSHNLFPFEVALYAVLTIPGLLGAGVTDWVLRRFARRAPAA